MINEHYLEHGYRHFRGDVPAHLVQSLDRYLQGVPPGGFLRAVLENDLIRAACKADDDNVLLLHSLCIFMCNEMPHGSFGSPEKVQRWLESINSRNG